MNIIDNYLKIKSGLPEHVTLIAVSKFHPASSIRDLYDSGCRDFGESRVQELVAKRAELPSDIRWHFIGHLQTNKIKEIAPFVHLIHGVDSVKLLRCIDTEAKKASRSIDCLLQVHIAKEESKFGFSDEEIESVLEENLHICKNINFRGLMGMATNTENAEMVSDEFASLHKLFLTVRSRNNSGVLFDTLSIGMSGDYNIALSHGSTMVRIGSSIFGER